VGQALALALQLAMPAVLAGFAMALVTGVLQAATQVQDASLSFVPRLLAVGAALMVSASFMTERLVAFTHELWQKLP